MWLVGKFCGTDTESDSNPNQWTVEHVGGDAPVLLTLSGNTHELSVEETRALRATLDEALSATRVFTHTVGEHRPDGRYVVERRRADSSGHRKVFDTYSAVRTLYDRLPDEFTVEEIAEPGLTGGRRHMLVHHFTEHPAFDCSLVSRQPLRARKHANGED